MALIIEDGTIAAGADSWITVAEWEAYATSYGRTVTGTEAEKEVMLRKAQRAISTRYTFQGTRVSEAQTTCLPRNWPNAIKGFTIGADVIPQDFKDAQAELAWSIHEGADPFADVTADNAAKGAVTGARSKAGPVETETTYSSGGASFSATSMSNYTAVMALLRPYLLSGSGQVRILRG